MYNRAICRVFVVLSFTFTLFAAAPAAHAEKMCGGRSAQGAMWWSIFHPGVGEWYLKGFGPLHKAPQKKFWLGFIPVYGWPGYLQVKSAIDSEKCLTNDNLTFRND
ncbi:MAG TPA: hypothetical protein VMR86_19950 [Myxococcota bacterium]|nr:hypothetical protein [Myxococcota bacterium]